MKKLVCAAVVAIAFGSVATTAAASPAVRLSILHFVRGCHVWSTNHQPTAKITLKHGTTLEIRVSCPMDFSFAQTAGPKLSLGDPVTHAGTVRRIVFRKVGVYRLAATNLQSSEEQGLQTLGPDNGLKLTVVVR